MLTEEPSPLMPNRPPDKPANQLYALLDELDRLEELIEDMDDLGVSSREDAERRMTDLDAQIEALAPDFQAGAEAETEAEAEQ
jgi:hypothetical protein